MMVLRNLLAAMLLAFTTGAGLAADRAIIVLDASGSMWGQIDGKPKLEIARETLRTVLTTIPAEMELGLIAYGHRQKGSCDDIELVVPPAAGTAGAITAAVDGMKFLGKTPLSAAVRKAAEDLRYTEDKATVILVTDGLETCSMDPCALGRELEQSGVDFTAHVVGFGLTEDEGRQVACLADTTGGKYFQAKDAEGLKDALEVAVAQPTPAPTPAPTPIPQPTPVPEPQPTPAPRAEFNFIPSTVLAAGDEPLGNANNGYEVYKARADGSQGDRVTTEYNQWKGNLEPGAYIVRAYLDQASVEQPITIEAGKVYEPVYVLNAGRLIVTPRPSAGADVADSAAVFIEYPGGSTTYYGKTNAVFPAGQTTISVKIGEGTVQETVELKAGQTLEKDIIVGVGHITINALYAEGGDQVTDSGLAIEIFKAKKKIDGSRESVTYGYGPGAKFDLPPGDYVVGVRMDQARVEGPFTIADGRTDELTVTLNAGVLAITAPGFKNIEVYAVAKDAQGNRQQFGYGFDGGHQTTLTAGDYIVVTNKGDAATAKETPVTVKAGERTELRVE